MSSERSSQQAGDQEGNRPILERDGKEETAAGNYFVSNYPPFSFWQREQVPKVAEKLSTAPVVGTPLGLYVHIPFCRKRCDFCYFRVYTDNDAKRVNRYVECLMTELEQYAAQPFLEGRKPTFVYFGGGTPSYLSVAQLTGLFEGLRSKMSLDDTEEITFECEPGTLQESKIRALKDLGVTRLSLGIENFDPDILELNNRAHRAKEIYTAYDCASDVGFECINIDLIAGMVGETEANWQICIEKALAMQPDSVTIYQLEVPFNTTMYRRMKDGQKEVAPVADWQTKRRWVAEAFTAFEAEGYRVASAYTVARSEEVQFHYTNGLWHGADMLGIGVASFSHLGGLHFQNDHDLEPYCERVEAGEMPVHRALELSADELLIREFILLIKRGVVEIDYFQDKFGVDVREQFAVALAQHESAGFLEVSGDLITVHRHGLLQIDRLLADFFLAVHRDARYA